jgi:hypothetical protein
VHPFSVKQYEWGENQYSFINLSSAKVVENEELKMIMLYKEKIEVGGGAAIPGQRVSR